jgi:hypothetical protein
MVYEGGEREGGRKAVWRWVTLACSRRAGVERESERSGGVATGLGSQPSVVARS